MLRLALVVRFRLQCWWITGLCGRARGSEGLVRVMGFRLCHGDRMPMTAFAFCLCGGWRKLVMDFWRNGHSSRHRGASLGG